MTTSYLSHEHDFFHAGSEERGLAASIHNPAAAMRVCQATAPWPRRRAMRGPGLISIPLAAACATAREYAVSLRTRHISFLPQLFYIHTYIYSTDR